MKPRPDDVVVVGMAALFPGAPDAPAFWENIVAGRSSISDPPPGEAARWFDPRGGSFDRPYCMRGGRLGDLARFDPLRYGIMPASLAGADPDHFIALRLAGDALADAGLDRRPFPRERTEIILGHGTYVNAGTVNWIQQGFVLNQTLALVRTLLPGAGEKEIAEIERSLRAGLPALTSENIPGMIPNILTGRIANRFDLMGDNYIVDAACASSTVALDHAVDHLLAGRCDVALAGGVQAWAPPQVYMAFCAIGVLSRTQEIRPFDRAADGTLPGEGGAVFVLRRRADAEKEGHRIYCAVKAVGISSNGRAKGLLSPRVEGEVLALQRAYAAAAVEPRSVEFVETHGTGIPVGDASEIESLRSVFGPRGRAPSCAIGAVKALIGHCIPASGAAGLVKAALALHHRVLPPSAGCGEPNPAFGLDDSPFYINREARPWIHAGPSPRRAGVNSFGFGGVNTHCVLEECGR